MKLTKILSIAVAAFASLTTVTFPLAAATLIACGEDNTAGTDEQPNAITAQINAAIDSAFADWSKSSTLIKVAQEPCEVCPNPSNYIIYDPSNTTLPPGVQTERGVLYRISLESFESFTCQTEETWFTYSVSTIDSLVRKNFVVPDSVSADEFKADCALENGEIREETEVTQGQKQFKCTLDIKSDSSSEQSQYTDPNWKKYVKTIIKICRE